MAYPTLNPNIIQSALYNMLIGMDILYGSINNNYDLIGENMEEAGLFGDSKIYIDSPNVDPYPWLQDSEDAINVLKLHRPGAPKTQALVINQYFQLAITTDAVLTKQEFMNEGGFVQYQSVLNSRLSKGKEVFLNKLYNTFIGVTKNVINGTESKLEIDTAAGGNSTGENIAFEIANQIDTLKDYTTEYTKNGFERAWADSDIKIVWNNKYVNAVRKIDIPSLFNSDAIASVFKGKKLPSRYFGDVNAHTTAAAGDRATKPLYLTIDGAPVYVPAGNEIPVGATIKAGDAYTVNSKIIAKIYTKMPKVLQAFTIGSDFYNGKNLSTNKYMTFGLNTLELFDSDVCITVYDSAE